MSTDLGKRQSRQSRNYGHQAEKHLIEEYGLEMDHDSWMDARRSTTGDPVEIKAAKYRMGNGREGRVLIRQTPHRKITNSDGWYGFVIYRPAGQGIEVVETKMTRARTVRIDSWQEIEDRDDEKQIPISRLF